MTTEGDKDILISGYDKAFSQIEGMQRAYNLRYSVYRTEHGILLEVCNSLRPGKCARFTMAEADETFAANLLQLLYENAAPMENVCDIARDMYLQYRENKSNVQIS